jgi:hypothetical protein
MSEWLCSGFGKWVTALLRWWVLTNKQTGGVNATQPWEQKQVAGIMTSNNGIASNTLDRNGTVKERLQCRAAALAE